MKFIFLILLSLLAASCSKGSSYAYYDIPPTIPAIEVDKRIYPLSVLESDKNIDVLFVIDNSGSMSNIQQNVIRNARTFLEQFAKQPYINWKIGVVSTDRRQAPFLGFDSSFDYTLIDYRDPKSLDNVVKIFQDAVADLGTDGDASEYVFYNVKRTMDLYDGKSPNKPSFLRPNSHFVVIMISDETEQSQPDFGNEYDAPVFAKTMSEYIGSNKILRFYGALSRRDLKGCDVSGDNDPYAGSQYEAIIKLTQGFNISACVDDFGVDLAKIGKDIASLVGLPSLLLKQRPIVDTLKVYYLDKLLPSGHRDNGGIWFYEENTNTINFYTMDFVKDPKNDYFKIDFDIDDGNTRN
jgi:hypothetical protein